MRQSLLIILAMILGSCLPKGKIGEQPVARTSQETSLKLSQSGPQASQRGLPDFCNLITKSRQFSCLECQFEGVKSLRCFDTFEPVEVAKVCRYTKQSLQCLINRGPQLVSIQFGKTSEEEFNKEFSVLLETMITVVSADEKLADLGKKSLLDFLNFVDTYHENFFQDGEWLSQFSALVDRVCRDTGCSVFEADQLFRVKLANLRTQRSSGTLDVSHGLDLVQSMTKLLTRDQGAIQLVESINVDGLVAH